MEPSKKSSSGVPVFILTLLVLTSLLDTPINAKNVSSDLVKPATAQGKQNLEWIRTVQQREGQQHYYRLGDAALSILLPSTQTPLSQTMVEHEARLLQRLLGRLAQVKEVKQLPPGPIPGARYYAILIATRADESTNTNRLEISALVSLRDRRWARIRYSALHAPDPRQSFAEALLAFEQIRELKVR